MRILRFVLALVGLVWLIGGYDGVMVLVLETLFAVLVLIPSVVFVLNALVLFRKEER